MGLRDRLTSLDQQVIDRPRPAEPTNGQRAVIALLMLVLGVVGAAAALAGVGGSRVMYGAFAVLFFVLMLILLWQIVRHR